MAISTVKATINGSTYNLSYDSSQNAWIANLTAPGATSFNLSGGYYDVQITATNDAGTQGTASAATNDGCKLKVKETVSPVITVQSPTSGAYTTNNKQPIVFTIIDESGGSGIRLDSLSLMLDREGGYYYDMHKSAFSTVAVTNGYSVTFTPPDVLADGEHDFEINCTDNDGNHADTAFVYFTVDTVPPVLNITTPAEGLITASTTITVAGTTNDSTSSPTTVKVNGKSVTVNSNGTFSTTVSLSEGSNTITIVATDSAGKSSTVTRHVTLNTKAPKITSVTITPNPANTGASMVLKVVVTE